MTKEERRNYWAATIEEFRSSGQSVPAFCADRDIKLHQMRYWLKKEKGNSTEKSLSWLPLDLSDAGLQNLLLVRVGGVAVEVRPGFDPKLLLDVVSTLVTR